MVESSSSPGADGELGWGMEDYGVELSWGRVVENWGEVYRWEYVRGRGVGQHWLGAGWGVWWE